MPLHRTREEHDANPPSSWVVVRLKDRVWALRTHAEGGVTLETSRTRRDAEAARLSGFWARQYAVEEHHFSQEATP